jgi:8-amino-7-oxononanoate synthase
MRSPQDELSLLESEGLLRRLRSIERVAPPLVVAAGRERVNFSSNDYLGLSCHPALKSAAAEATERFGTGSTASRLVCGSLEPHHELEETIARLKGTEAALSFSCGYTCALGTVTALVGPEDTVILDKLSHACLVDGARQSGATLRVYPHNHLEKLERLLVSAREKTGPGGRILVITESVFSMDGDRAALAGIIELKERHGAMLLLDEAHAVGILGPAGQGLAEELGLQERIDLQMGTLGKAIGSAGGYLAADQATIGLLINKARPFIYSTAPPPAQAAAAAAGLRLVSSPEGRRLRELLWSHLREFARLMQIDEPQSAIIPLIIGENEAALAAAGRLLDAGLLVPAMRYPTVARGTARLRVTLSAAHDIEQVRFLASTLTSLSDPA